MKYIIYIILILVLIFCVYSKKPVIEGLNTFNGKMSIDDQYFYDKLFDDVIYYPNKYDKDYDTGEEIGKLLKTGWQECREKCPGHCVEYGISSNAYCFQKPKEDQFI